MRYYGYGNTADFIQAASGVIDVINSITSIGASGFYNLGSFGVLGGDLRSIGSLSDESLAVIQPPDSSNSFVNWLKNLEKRVKGLHFPVLDNRDSLFGVFWAAPHACQL